MCIDIKTILSVEQHENIVEIRYLDCLRKKTLLLKEADIKADDIVEKKI